MFLSCYFKLSPLYLPVPARPIPLGFPPTVSQFCLFLPFPNYHFHSQSLHLPFLLCTNWYSMTQHIPLNPPSSANVLLFTLEGLFAWRVSIQWSSHGHFLHCYIISPGNPLSPIQKLENIHCFQESHLQAHWWQGRCFPFFGVQHSLVCCADHCDSFSQILASSPQGSVPPKQRGQAFLQRGIPS